MKEVSIIIPIYNVEKYVAECLNSVISQTYDHSKIECIIVNDCTTDDSMDIVYEIIKKYDGGMSFIICRHEHNEGVSAARNTGIEVAKGNYIFFIDSDDYIYPNSLELLLNASKIYGYPDMVVGNFYYESLKKNNYTFDKVFKLKYIDSMFWGKTLKLNSCNILIKRTVFIETGIRFSVGRYFEDIIVNYQLFPNINEAIFIPECTYFYRDNQNGIMHKSFREKIVKAINDYLYALNLFIDHLDKRMCIGKVAIILRTYFVLFDLLNRNADILNEANEYKRSLRRISHSLIYYNFTHIRIFLLMLSVLTLQPISNKIVNSRFFRSNIDRVFKLLLYPALWTNKLHFY